MMFPIVLYCAHKASEAKSADTLKYCKRVLKCRMFLLSSVSMVSLYNKKPKLKKQINLYKLFFFK